MSHLHHDLPVVIIGAGPAGLMAAEILSQAGYRVDVYEQKPSAARKFLMAGKTGLNISHIEPFEQFIQRYDQVSWLAPMVQAFDAQAIQDWMAGLGIASYVGSSGRIFPKEMKAAPLLRAWLARLKHQGVRFFYRHQWLGWDDAQVVFDTEQGHQKIPAAAVILATGGGSWARLGSDAAWLPILQQQQIQIEPLQPSNVGIVVAWSEHMQRIAGQPLKRINAWVSPQRVFHGEAVISSYGLEGGLIYKLSRDVREQFQQQQVAIIYLDLLPDLSEQELQKKLSQTAKQTLTNLWRKVGLDAVKSALIREVVAKQHWSDAAYIAKVAKQLPVQIQHFQPMDEAISTAGGVALSAIDAHLMLKKKAGIFCCGEMLDWDAPTGGYLLTACLATGRQAGFGVINWLENQSHLTD
jgi:uncharacterized flavoprotein (TIGR03862 family)